MTSAPDESPSELTSPVTPAQVPNDKLSRIRPRLDAYVGDGEDLVDLQVSEWDVERTLNP